MTTLEILIALAKLSPRERQVVVDRYWLNHSISRIAEDLGITYQQAANFSSKGMAKLRKQVAA